MESDGFSPLSINSSIIKFIHSKKTLFTLGEYKNESDNPEAYEWFNSSLNSWIILPLWVSTDLFGFIQLKESEANMDLDVEDHDLLDIIAHHIALSLSLDKSSTELQQAERFKQCNNHFVN